MIKTIAIMFLCLSMLPFTVSAQNKEKQMTRKEKRAEWDSLHGFEKQARQYSRRSRVAARQAKNTKDPYLKERLEQISEHLGYMSDCKREALAAEKAGKKYDWREYEKAQKDVGKLQQEVKQRRAVAGDKGGVGKDSKEAGKPEKKQVKSDTEKKEVDTAAVAEEKVQKKPRPKTFKTADGFMIRTSL